MESTTEEDSLGSSLFEYAVAYPYCAHVGRLSYAVEDQLETQGLFPINDDRAGFGVTLG